MPERPITVVCDRCRGDALRIEVRKYVWRTKTGEKIPVDNALIIKCRNCGEYAATGNEQKRWTAQQNRLDAAERDPDERCCDECGKPQSLTGQFFTYGEVGYCRECNDAVGPSAQSR